MRKELTEHSLFDHLAKPLVPYASQMALDPYRISLAAVTCLQINNWEKKNSQKKTQTKKRKKEKHKRKKDKKEMIKKER